MRQEFDMNLRKKLIVSLFVILSALAINYVVLRATGQDYLSSAEGWIAGKAGALSAGIKKTFQSDPNVKISEKEFEELFRAICPELLTRYGIPLSQAYADILRQYEGKVIDEAMMRALLEDWKAKRVSYDGKAFYHMDGKADDGKVPNKPIDPENLRKDTVPIQFFLDNEVFYSNRIFEILTGQKSVKFAHQVKEGMYVFEAQRDMTQAEFFRVVAKTASPKPTEAVKRGDRWNFPADSLREISRVFEVKKSFTDHLGNKRTVNVFLDLSNYMNIDSKITSLPDGTVVASDKGALNVSTDKLVVQRVDGRHVTYGDGWGYEEDGKMLFRAINDACSYTAYGTCANMTEVSIYKETAEATGVVRDIFRAEVDQGTTSLTEADGTKFRVIDGASVKDAAGSIITDVNDIGVKVQQAIYHSHAKMTVRHNLEAYLDTSPFMKKLAEDIVAPYSSKNERAQAVLDFVHSFTYKPGMIISYAKGPKEYLLSLEGDCKDATILTGSLWASAGIPFGFGYFSNINPSEAGHVAPYLSRSACCSGQPKGNWLYAEATGTNWRIGQDPDYSRNGLVLRVFQPHGKPPMNVK